ncbi:hypothetical protein EMIT0111MI5_130207 [Burkholderia sp. IT-111MI5]
MHVDRVGSGALELPPPSSAADRGLVLLYLRRFRGVSRAHVTRLVKHSINFKTLMRVRRTSSNAFCATLHGCQSGRADQSRARVWSVVGAGYVRRAATHVPGPQRRLEPRKIAYCLNHCP